MDILLPIGHQVPGFELPDLDGVRHSLAEFRGRITIIYFWSAECSWCQRTDQSLPPLLSGWGPGTALLTIACNRNEPLELLRRVATERSLPLVLQDGAQLVSDMYAVAITPHLFVIDPNGILRYQGAFDDVTFRQRTPTRQYLQQAVDALLAGGLPDPAHTPAYGCAVVRNIL